MDRFGVIAMVGHRVGLGAKEPGTRGGESGPSAPGGCPSTRRIALLPITCSPGGQIDRLTWCYGTLSKPSCARRSGLPKAIEHGTGKLTEGISDPATLGFLSGGGETGALMRAHDWSASPLGSPEGGLNLCARSLACC